LHQVDCGAVLIAWPFLSLRDQQARLLPVLSMHTTHDAVVPINFIDCYFYIATTITKQYD
jgi:hypothetical protein